MMRKNHGDTEGTKKIHTKTRRREGKLPQIHRLLLWKNNAGIDREEGVRLIKFELLKIY